MTMTPMQYPGWMTWGRYCFVCTRTIPGKVHHPSKRQGICAECREDLERKAHTGHVRDWAEEQGK